MDEQKQIILIATPVMTQESFAQLTGLTEGQVRGMIEKGHLPSLKVGKPTMTMRYSHLSPSHLKKVLEFAPSFE